MDATLKTLWLVGRRFEHETNDRPWEVMGIFDTEAAAAAACSQPLDFLAPVEINVRLPEQTDVWHGAYYPSASAEELESVTRQLEYEGKLASRYANTLLRGIHEKKEIRDRYPTAQSFCEALRRNDHHLSLIRGTGPGTINAWKRAFLGESET